MLPSGENGAVASLPKGEILSVKQSFAALILGGTGQVGGAAVAELLVTFGMPGSGDGHQKAHCAAIAGTQCRS